MDLSESEYNARLDELDRILNDPEVPMEPARVWSLLAEIAGREGGRLLLPVSAAKPCAGVGPLLP